MPGPPPPPASSAAAAASWASWKAERFCVARLKRTRASTSSCGSGGSEEKVISGAETRPSTVTMAVTSPDWVAATKWSCGSRLPTSCSEPSSNSMRWPRMSSRPRRRSNWPTGWMSLVGALHAQLAAELDVEAAAAHEDLVRRADPDVEADAAAVARRRPGCGVPTLARSSVTCTGGGGRMWSTWSSAAWALAPRPSAIEISVRPRSIRAREQPPPPTSGPCSAQLAGEPGADEGAVGVAHVVDPHGEVGRESRGAERDPALGGDVPPLATSARKLRSTRRCPRGVASRAMACRRRLVCGSTRVPPCERDACRRAAAPSSEPRAGGVDAEQAGSPGASRCGQQRVGDRQRHGAGDARRRGPGRRAGSRPEPVRSRPPAPVTRAR